MGFEPLPVPEKRAERQTDLSMLIAFRAGRERAGYRRMLRRCSTSSALLQSGWSNGSVRATDGMMPPTSIRNHRDAGEPAI